MSDLAEALMLLRDAYPRQPFGERAIVVYAEQLADLDETDVYLAVQEIVRTQERAPTISEIRRTVAETKLALPTAEEAWEMVLANAIERGGKQLPDPVKRALKAVGGPWIVRHSENPGTLYAQFRKHYEAARDRVVRDEAAGEPIRPEQLRPGRPGPLQLPPAGDDGETEVTSLARRKLDRLPVTDKLRPRDVVD